MERIHALHSFNAPKNRARPIAVVKVRALTSPLAGAYIGHSDEWMRKTRYADEKRIENGEKPQGPRWVEIKRGQRKAIRYLIEDLDAFIDSWRLDEAVGWPEIPERETVRYPGPEAA